MNWESKTKNDNNGESVMLITIKKRNIAKVFSVLMISSVVITGCTSNTASANKNETTEAINTESTESQKKNDNGMVYYICMMEKYHIYDTSDFAENYSHGVEYSEGLDNWAELNYKDAERKILSIKEEIDEKGAAFPEDIAFINQALGCLYIDMAKYSEAYDLLLDSYVLFEKQYGSKSPYTICSEANMCHYYYAVGDYDRCLLEKQKILDNNENVTEYSNYFKLTLNDIEACIAKDRGEIVNSYNKYNENLKICMEIMEKNDETPMFIKSFFIKTLESLGDTSYQLDSAKYTESSIKFYDLAIQNLDKIQDTGKYSDSYRSCLVIKKEMLSQESEESAKKISDAIKKLEDIYEADDSYPVLIEPFLLYSELLGFVTGNETEAINYYEKAHKIAEKAYGYNHPLNGKIFESEGRYYSNKIHDNETALNKSQQGLEICKNLLIENSRLAASLYISLAGEYKALGDDKKSEEYLEKGKDVLEKLGSRFLTQDEIKEASQN